MVRIHLRRRWRRLLQCQLRPRNFLLLSSLQISTCRWDDRESERVAVRLSDLRSGTMLQAWRRSATFLCGQQHVWIAHRLSEQMQCRQGYPGQPGQAASLCEALCRLAEPMDAIKGCACLAIGESTVRFTEVHGESKTLYSQKEQWFKRRLCCRWVKTFRRSWRSRGRQSATLRSLAPCRERHTASKGWQHRVVHRAAHHQHQAAR